MKELIGRRVELVSGAMYPVQEGRVVHDRGEQVVVDCDGDLRYIAKYRLLCNEYGEFERPDAVGVYLIREPEDL